MATKQSGKGGFFAKDEDFGTRMDERFQQGEQWLALSCEQDTPFIDKDGQAINRTKFLAREIDPETMQPVGLPIVVKTLSAPIYANAGEAVASDFPAVVAWERVEVKQYGNEATVLRRISTWPVPQEYLDLMSA